MVVRINQSINISINIKIIIEASKLSLSFTDIYDKDQFLFNLWKTAVAFPIQHLMSFSAFPFWVITLLSTSPRQCAPSVIFCMMELTYTIFDFLALILRAILVASSSYKIGLRRNAEKSKIMYELECLAGKKKNQKTPWFESQCTLPCLFTWQACEVSLCYPHAIKLSEEVFKVFTYL